MYRHIRTGSPRRATVVAAVGANPDRLPRGLGQLDRAVDGALSSALVRPGFTGARGQIAFGDESGVLIGLGDVDTLSTQDVRNLGAALAKALHKADITAVQIECMPAIKTRGLDADTIGQSLAEGMVLANWRMETYRGTAAKGEAATGNLTIGASDAALRGGLRRGIMLAEAANESRRLGATPPNVANPAWIAKQARALARSSSITTKVIGAAELKTKGFGGITAVGQGSDSPPCMVIMQHKPRNARKDVHLVLVGKTITYDTGGYSLKINNSMKGMKYDMCGGAAVLGAMKAIADLRLPIRVTGVLACAENMVSGNAYRPDDIIKMYNGVTVEVTNTDAEGRLVLADALAYSCKHLKPTHLVNAATLTGGVVVALGEWCAGLWCNDDDFRSTIQAAGESTGERLWQLPLWEEHRDFMRSRHADIWNSGPRRSAHPIQGAAFLSYFVDKDVPWAHVDLAGPATTDSPLPTSVVGPTGFGTRLMAETAARLAR
ncbi:MAG: leucyl aminopeptidase family protein [Phycisphaerales bacterium]|nr:leucyl aminopeptidase family protein [Phycisphaerales bacterium]